MKAIIALSLFALTTLSPAQAAEKKPEATKQEAKDEPAFNMEGDWTFTITHQADTSKLQFPGSPIPDETYKPIPEPAAGAKREWQPMHFSFHGTKLTVKDPNSAPLRIGPMKEASKTQGVRHYTTPDPSSSENCNLTLKQTKEGVVGTMTCYGSGRPVLWTVRGPLVKAEAEKAKPKK